MSDIDWPHPNIFILTVEALKPQICSVSLISLFEEILLLFLFCFSRHRDSAWYKACHPEGCEHDICQMCYGAAELNTGVEGINSKPNVAYKKKIF